MMQREIEKKDSVIKKLKIELTKNHDIIKNDLNNILTEKMTDFETKTRDIKKEEIKQTKNFMKESSQKTWNNEGA